MTNESEHYNIEISDDIAAKGAHYLSLGLDCNVSAADFQEAVAFAFSAMKKKGKTDDE